MLLGAARARVPGDLGDLGARGGAHDPEVGGRGRRTAHELAGITRGVFERYHAVMVASSGGQDVPRSVEGIGDRDGCLYHAPGAGTHAIRTPAVDFIEIGPDPHQLGYALGAPCPGEFDTGRIPLSLETRGRRGGAVGDAGKPPVPV